MTVDRNKAPDYQKLFQTLLNKTEAGKLRWEETASEDTFLAAVKGQQSFELRPVPGSASIHLTVRDAAGKVLFEVNEGGAGRELYKFARRLALRIDDKLENSLELLSQL